MLQDLGECSKAIGFPISYISWFVIIPNYKCVYIYIILYYIYGLWYKHHRIIHQQANGCEGVDYLGLIRDINGCR